MISKVMHEIRHKTKKVPKMAWNAIKACAHFCFKAVKKTLWMLWMGVKHTFLFLWARLVKSELFIYAGFAYIFHAHLPMYYAILFIVATDCGYSLVRGVAKWCCCGKKGFASGELYAVLGTIYYILNRYQFEMEHILSNKIFIAQCLLALGFSYGLSRAFCKRIPRVARR